MEELENIRVTIKVEDLGEETIYMTPDIAAEVFAHVTKYIANGLSKDARSRRLNTNIPSCDHSAQLKDCCENKQVVEHKDFNHPVLSYGEHGMEMNEGYEAPTSTIIGDDVIDHYERKIGIKKTAPVKVEEDFETMEEALNINPFTHSMFRNKKLTAFRCPECVEVTVRFASLNETNIMKCHFCKAKFPIHKVVYGEISCPNCSQVSRMYLADDISEVHCKNCDSPIDVIYYQDGHKTKAKSADITDK
jgi:DNA-directed RNA polymerase subunit RPC12/RpoP